MSQGIEVARSRAFLRGHRPACGSVPGAQSKPSRRGGRGCEHRARLAAPSSRRFRCPRAGDVRRLLYRMTRVAPRDIVNLSPVRKSVERQFKVTSRLRLGVKAEGRGHGVWAARSHQDAGPAFRYPELCSEEQSRTLASMRRRVRLRMFAGPSLMGCGRGRWLRGTPGERHNQEGERRRIPTKLEAEVAVDGNASPPNSRGSWGL